MGSEMVELDIPPEIRAIFEEWAKDFDAAPKPVAKLAEAQGSDLGELAMFYHLLAKPIPCKMLSRATMLGLYVQVQSNRNDPSGTGISAEASRVWRWLDPIMRAHFPEDLPK
jgi:hypothetical protein